MNNKSHLFYFEHHCTVSRTLKILMSYSPIFTDNLPDGQYIIIPLPQT